MTSLGESGGSLLRGDTVFVLRMNNFGKGKMGLVLCQDLDLFAAMFDQDSQCMSYGHKAH